MHLQGSICEHLSALVSLPILTSHSWEILISCGFDLNILSGGKKLRWPMVSIVIKTVREGPSLSEFSIGILFPGPLLPSVLYHRSVSAFKLTIPTRWI